MKTIYGDLVELAKQGKFDVIVHGCNCLCCMGAGIAKQIKKEFPKAYKVDKGTIPGDSSKLGRITYSSFKRNNGTELIIVNAYTQFSTDSACQRKDLVEYDALRSCFKTISKMFNDKRIGYPKIGAGLARGDWDKISKIIDEELIGLDHTLVILP